MRATISHHILPLICLENRALRWRSGKIGRTSQKTGGLPVPENGKFPFGRRGAKATQNGNHNLVRLPEARSSVQSTMLRHSESTEHHMLEPNSEKVPEGKGEKEFGKSVKRVGVQLKRIFSRDLHATTMSIGGNTLLLRRIESTPDPDTLKSITIHLPFLSRCFCKSMPFSLQKVVCFHHQFISRCGSRLYRDAFADVLGSGSRFHRPQTGPRTPTFLKRGFRGPKPPISLRSRMGCKREFPVKKSPFPLCSLAERKKRGIFDRKLPFPGRGEMGVFGP